MESDLLPPVVFLASLLTLLAAPLLAAAAVAAGVALSYRFGLDRRDGAHSGEHRRGQLWWRGPGRRD